MIKTRFFLDRYPYHLLLENGNVFNGYCAGPLEKDCIGEVVFNTGMTGYPESLTDPSYAGQILVFTYPLIGNYGIPPQELWESARIHVRGAIVCQSCDNWSHYQGLSSLAGWLKSQDIPLLTGVDTRALTKRLRSSGTMLGIISDKKSFPDNVKEEHHWVAKVSTPQKRIYGSGAKTVAVVDCGVKENILRSLSKFPITIHRVPHDYDYTSEDYDGILISNGPGDPASCTATIEILRKALTQNRPIFGICLGTQLMALASGAQTYKLPYGHRGHNQPCIDLETKRCYVTSQNHGYAVDGNSLRADWQVSFQNLNDSSVEGIRHAVKPFFSVQFHPEACPGPTDTVWLFEQFYEAL